MKNKEKETKDKDKENKIPSLNVYYSKLLPFEYNPFDPSWDIFNNKGVIYKTGVYM